MSLPAGKFWRPAGVEGHQALAGLLDGEWRDRRRFAVPRYTTFGHGRFTFNASLDDLCGVLHTGFSTWPLEIEAFARSKEFDRF